MEQSITLDTFRWVKLSSVLTKECVTRGGCLIISTRLVSSTSFGCSSLGHSCFGFFRNSGPSHDTWLLISSLADKPREGKSAGFSLLGQCRHLSLGVSCRISCTRCRTYCFHGLSFCIHCKVVVQSVQKNFSMSSSMRSEFEMELNNLAEITAPRSSNRGIVWLLIGATLVFEATRRISMCPSL